MFNKWQLNAPKVIPRRWRVVTFRTSPVSWGRPVSYYQVTTMIVGKKRSAPALRTFSRGFVLWRFSCAGRECSASFPMGRRSKIVAKGDILVGSPDNWSLYLSSAAEILKECARHLGASGRLPVPYSGFALAKRSTPEGHLPARGFLSRHNERDAGDQRDRFEMLEHIVLKRVDRRFSSCPPPRSGDHGAVNRRSLSDFTFAGASEVCDAAQ